MLIEFMAWIYNDNPSLSFTNSNLSLEVVEQELLATKEANRQLLATLRMVKFKQSHSSSANIESETKDSHIESSRFLIDFLEFCKVKLKEQNLSSLFFLALQYLLFREEKNKDVNFSQKIIQLFSRLLQENTIMILDFYSQNVRLFENHPEIKSLAESTINFNHGLKAVKEHLSLLEEHLTEENNPLGLVMLFRNLLSETEKFAAILLWLIEQKFEVTAILQTGLLQDFMRYNLIELGLEENQVTYLYKLLERFPQAAQLIEQAAATRCEQEGWQAYSLDGRLDKKMPLQEIKITPASLDFTPTPHNFKALHQLFGQPFLQLALLWAVSKENEIWLSLLGKSLNQPDKAACQLAELIDYLAQEKPQLLERLACLLELPVLEQLIFLGNGRILYLLPYKPAILDKIDDRTITTYLAQIVKDSDSEYDFIAQLSLALHCLVKQKHPSAERIFSALIDSLYQYPDLLEDLALRQQLRSFPGKEANLSLRNDMLWQDLDEVIAANTDEAVLLREKYQLIEDAWLNISKKMQILTRIHPALETKFCGKYELYIRIAQRCFKRQGQNFKLDAFMSALSPQQFTDDEILSLQERIYIEILSAIDDAWLRAQLIDKLEKAPLHVVNWQEKKYGSHGVFIKAAQQGNEGLLQEILAEKAQTPALLNQAVCLAAEASHWNVVSCLCQDFSFVLTKKTQSKVLIQAAKQGELAIFKTFSSLDNSRQLSNKLIGKLLELAVTWGHLELVGYCFLTFPCQKIDMDALFNLAFNLGHREIVACLCEQPKPPQQIQIDKVFAFALLDTENKLPLIQFFCGLKNPPSKTAIEHVYKEAAASGDLAIVNHLSSLACFKLTPTLVTGALVAASVQDQLLAVELLSNLNPKPALAEALQASIKTNKWKIAQYYCQQVKTKSMQIVINTAWVSLAKAGDLDRIKCLSSLEIQPHQRAINTALLEVAKSKDLIMAAFLCKGFPLAQVILGKALIQAVIAKQEPMVCYLCQLLKEKPLERKVKIAILKVALTKAISMQQEELVIYLRGEISPVKRNHEQELSSCLTVVSLNSPLISQGFFKKSPKSLSAFEETGKCKEQADEAEIDSYQRQYL